MEFKKAIKRIVALGTGASMVGATIFGAMAADLANYPNQYIKDGKFTGVLVVGDKAAAEDVIGVSDIAVSLQFAATKAVDSTTGTTAPEGDSWKVGSSTKMLELGENLNSGSNVETLRNITTYVGDSELKALASGTASNGKGDAPMKQYFYLQGVGSGAASGYVVYTTDDEDVTADFLYFKSGHEIGRYVLEFTTALQSDVDDSAGTATTTGDYLTDLEDVTLNMFGKDYTIVQARRNGGKIAEAKFILMGGSSHDTLLEGATKTYNVKGKDYEVTLDYVDATTAKFTVNGQATRKMLDGDTDKLSDGTTIGVSQVLYQAYAGGVHSASFFIGAQKVELKDTNINNTDSSNSLKVDDKSLSQSYVIVEGSDDGTTYKLNRISVNMTADDNYFIPVGGKLSTNPNVDDNRFMFTNNWDIEYAGLSKPGTTQIKIKTSGSSAYDLEFTDANGKKVSVPIAKSPSGSGLVMGDTAKKFVNVENITILKNDYFVLSDFSQKRGERKTVILQYKGSDKVTADSPTLKFKDLGSGDTIEQTYTAGTGEAQQKLATLKVGGADYNVYNATGITSNDFGIVVDLDASGALATGNSSVNPPVPITTKEGVEINITNVTSPLSYSAPSSPTVYVSFRVPDNTLDSSAADKTQSLQATPFMLNITASSGKVAFSQDTSSQGQYLQFKTPSGKTNIAYGYDSYGDFFTHETPTSDPAVLTIDVPAKQVEALIYITSKASGSVATTSASSGGAVSIQRIDVGATKLASEVTDINAVNSILVGGPCANAAAATVLKTGADCTAGFEPGVGKVAIYDVGTSNVAMLVAGYSAADTRNAAAVVANYGDYKAKLKGAAVEVTKVNNVLTVAEPTVKKVEEPVAAPAAAPAPATP